jgi:hypothetical protein
VGPFRNFSQIFVTFILRSLSIRLKFHCEKFRKNILFVVSSNLFHRHLLKSSVSFFLRPNTPNNAYDWTRIQIAAAATATATATATANQIISISWRMKDESNELIA